jgi:PAS domain S-box-containing protein
MASIALTRNSLLRVVIDTVPALVWSTTAEGLLDYWNARHLEYTGLTGEELQGWGWTRAIHPDDLGQLVEKWRAGLAQGDAYEGEARLRRADGVYRWHLFRGVPLRDANGTILKWCGATSDIEALKSTEVALRRSEVFLAKAQRLSTTGSFGWSAITGDISWSEETFRVYEYDRNLVKPTLEEVLARIHPDDRALVRGVVDRLRLDGTDLDFEHRLLFPDGRVKHIHCVVQAVGASGAGEFVGAVMDVTAAKEMQQALAFRDQVMGILGHDLRSPLGAVLGIAGLMQLNDELPLKAREQLVQVERAAKRMREMIEALLDFTQTRFAGKLPVSPAPADLREICGRVVAELAAGNPCRKIDLESQGDACGRWDPGRIAQVISNLLANALTHGDPQAPVRLSIEGDTNDVALKVHNRGPAVAQDQIPVLFEPFRRGAGADTRRVRGLGLGLHIVKQIVTAHGGSISVHSSADEGTTFCVALPRVRERS